MGSVKDLEILEKPETDKLGHGRFIFSDRYSVFDWGEMPDHINDKGKSLALLSGFFLEKLEAENIKTHYKGIVEDGHVKKLNDLQTPTNSIEISMVRVVKPSLNDKIYDYSIFKNEKNNFLIPFEIIYRNQLPENSSIFKRLKNNEITPEYFGLTEPPVPGQILEKPIYDISTKLEINDRYITWDEAQKMGNLTDKEIQNIKDIISQVNNIISKEVERIGLINEDGKIELAFNENREIVVVDTLGTLDECRFKYKDYPISKEMARRYYRKTEWFVKVEEAKEKDRFNWKEIVGQEPEPLPEEFKNLFSDMYRTVANKITGKQFFSGVPDLNKIILNMKKYIT